MIFLIPELSWIFQKFHFQIFLKVFMLFKKSEETIDMFKNTDYL